MARLVQPAAVALGAIACWGLLAQLILVEDVGRLPAFAAPRVLTYVLLIVAPLLTFRPLARWARAPLYDVEGVAGWSALGYVLAFVTPADPPSLAQFLLFIVPLTVALATVMTLVAYLIGLRVYRGDVRGHDVVRARREGYLAAIGLIALALLYSIGTLSPTSAALLLLVVALIEVLALSRDGDRPRRAVSRRPERGRAASS